MALIRLDISIFCYKYVRLYTACENLMVNVDQQHDLQKRTKNETGNKRVTVIFGTVAKYYWKEKAVYSTYSDYVFVALYNQLAKCMLCIKLPCFPCLAATYFSTLFHKRYKLQKMDY